MHLCLSCNQPCSISSIFCEACRLSLLERRTEEEPGMISEGEEEEFADLAVQGTPLALNSEAVLSQPETNGNSPQAERKYLWSWDTSNLYAAENAVEAKTSMAFSPAPPSFIRRVVMPAPVKRALLIFIIVGILALSVDGVLLAVSMTRHHTRASTIPSAHSSGEVSDQLFLTPVSQVPTQVSLDPTPLISHNDAFMLSTPMLSFVAIQGQPAPNAQTVVLSSATPAGFSWQITSAPPSWLHLSSLQGSAISGARATLLVSVDQEQLDTATYNALLQIKATDDKGQTLPNGVQSLNVTLVVQASCSLQVTPTKLAFSTNLLQPVPPSQKLTLKESGSCSRPVNWQISANVAWITFSSISGQDQSSNDTISVQANNPNKIVGTFTAILTLQATDNNGLALENSPFQITVTLTVIV